jgi:hypothetical protein
MRLPNQPPKYDQNLEQQRSSQIEREVQQLRAEISSASTGTPTGIVDGDYGDVVVSGSGSVWAIDSSVCTTAGRALIGGADASAQRTTLGLGTAAVSATGDFAAASHSHSASDISSGTVATARLGNGTADGTTFLRGDQTWAAPAGGGLSQSQVLARSLGA